MKLITICTWIGTLLGIFEINIETTDRMLFINTMYLALCYPSLA